MTENKSTTKTWLRRRAKQMNLPLEEAFDIISQNKNTSEKTKYYVNKWLGSTQVCLICDQEFKCESAGRIRSQSCKKCYPFFRKAYSFVHTTRHRALKSKIDFDLDIEWVIERFKKSCPKTGIIFDLDNKDAHYGTRSPHVPSVDKINPSKGYTKDNCQIVCWWYNCAKQRFTEEQVLNLCRKVVETAKKV